MTLRNRGLWMLKGNYFCLYEKQARVRDLVQKIGLKVFPLQ